MTCNTPSFSTSYTSGGASCATRVSPFSRKSSYDSICGVDTVLCRKKTSTTRQMSDCVRRLVNDIVEWSLNHNSLSRNEGCETIRYCRYFNNVHDLRLPAFLDELLEIFVRNNWIEELLDIHIKLWILELRKVVIELWRCKAEFWERFINHAKSFKCFLRRSTRSINDIFDLTQYV